MDRQMDENASPAIASHRESRATSPGGQPWRETKSGKVVEVPGLPKDVEVDDQQSEEGKSPKPSRYRPRTFPYQHYLPYPHKDDPIRNLRECMNRLYIAISAGDFVPGATHWTRELRAWIQLKFDLPRDDRIKLVELYYELSLAPGLDNSAVERFGSMFMTLTKRKHYLRPGEDLYLNWRPLYRELKTLVLPLDTGAVTSGVGNHSKRSSRALLKMCSFAQLYFDPRQIPEMLEEILPYFATSNLENAFAVMGLLNLLLPTGPAPEGSKWQPQHFLPTIFHLSSLLSRSKTADFYILDLFSRLARDHLTAEQVPFSEFGIFTSEQAALIFTAVLRLGEIPVSQVSSPYSTSVDMWVGLASVLERDQRKHPMSHHIARWIVMSLSPLCVEKEDSMLSKLEGLIQAVETFFHPSNTGAWTKTLSQLVFYLSDFFVMRWNREHSGEMQVPESRRLNDAVRRRFVLCLRDVTFMGIFAKSGTAMSYSLSSLQSLAYLEPSLILPGALQRIYPSMRGLVEVHRTSSSIRALHELTRTMIRMKGFRCHVTSLLGLALPGIDANDLDKTMYTLLYMQAVFYDMPLHDLTKQSEAEKEAETPQLDGMLAAHWVTGEIERLEREGVDVEIDYEKELTDEDEIAIVRSSTADFQSFLSSFLDRVFNLLRNLPDASRIKNGSPEENIANTLPATFTPLFSCMAPELYDLALEKIADFISKHVVYQARDATAFICSVVCKANPKKALGTIIPIVIRAIRMEIEENGAGSTRTTGSEVLPRDRALVWNISLLSMSVVHCGNAVTDFKDDLLEIAQYMRKRCKGIPATHASNFIHHVLLTLTMTYTVDQSLFNEADLAQGITAASWGVVPDTQRLNIKWHYADEDEVNFAIKIFQTFADIEIERLSELTGDSPSIKRDGSGKEWSDEVSRSLVVLRLILAGTSSLFDPRYKAPSSDSKATTGDDQDMVDGDEVAEEDLDDDDDADADAEAGAGDDEDVKPTFHYSTGYHLDPGSDTYEQLHALRTKIGEMLHSVHGFLTQKQQDDVTAFNALYTTYRSWFTDVGIERSAHVLDRVTRLLVADTSHFKVSGLRKEYPRPLLVRRANVYHLQRLRHSATPRRKTDLDIILLQDLVESSVSYYTEIRRTAQTAIESSTKVIIGARPILIPPLIEHWEAAIAANDFPRIKGAMFSLLFGTLTKSVGRDWRYAPSLMKTYVAVMDIDKVSVQKIATGAAIQIMDMTRVPSRLVILDDQPVDRIGPDASAEPDRAEAAKEKIAKRREKISERHTFVRSERAKLADELVEVAKNSHWRKESRTSTIVIGLGLGFENIAPTKMVDLVVTRTVDTHPSLRAIYNSALIGLFTYTDMRAISDHKYENLLLDKKKVPGFVRKEIDQSDPELTDKFLDSFKQANTDVYVDHEYPGWLAWSRSIPAFAAAEPNALEYDETETAINTQIGALITREWLTTYFGYLKQEPRDATSDRFRMTNIMALTGIFNLLFTSQTTATFEDLKELLKDVYGDGSDKHQHRATAEILGGIISSTVPLAPEKREEIWAYVFPILRQILEDGLTPENSNYWLTCLDYIIQNKDPRRSWPLIEWIASFRLNMESNAAFKESSKITLLEHVVDFLGWHFQLDKPVLDDFLSHLDHPYKGVREVMGRVLAAIYRSRYHESYKDVHALVEAQKAISPVGGKPYDLGPEFENTVNEVFARIEKWRLERPAGQQTASSYTSGAKTVLAWLDNTLSYCECTQMIPFFPDTMIEALLNMMDIKEDPELQAYAYSAYRHLGNIPYRAGEEGPFVDACIRIGRTASQWHQRLRVLILIQAIYFRHLFLMPRSRQTSLFDTVAAMLEDSQFEVRVGAQATLSGMIRCSPVSIREDVIHKLTKQFTDQLRDNPLPKKRNPGTPTPEHNRLVLVRHSSALGLGALVQAFPYTSPPPPWIPKILATLATKAAGDPGMVGKSAKSIVSEFKKTRQDTWHIDIKAFTPEQLEDLEGVLWKSYFA